MTTIEKAYKIRNLWNRWNDYGKQESMLCDKIMKLEEEMKGAKYKQNGYEHFKVFGAWLDLEGVTRQKAYLVSNHEKAVNHMMRIENLIEQLLTGKEEEP